MGTVSDADLAKEYGIATSSITKERANRGIPSFSKLTGQNGRYKPSQLPASTKVTKEIAQEIRGRYQKGKITVRELTKDYAEYGITESGVHQIIQGFNWKEVPK